MQNTHTNTHRFGTTPLLNTVSVPTTVYVAFQHPCLSQSSLHTSSIIRIKPICLSSTLVALQSLSSLSQFFQAHFLLFLQVQFMFSSSFLDILQTHKCTYVFTVQRLSFAFTYLSFTSQDSHSSFKTSFRVFSFMSLSSIKSPVCTPVVPYLLRLQCFSCLFLLYLFFLQTMCSLRARAVSALPHSLRAQSSDGDKITVQIWALVVLIIS